MSDMKAYQELAGRQSLLEPAPVASPTNATAKFLAERYAVGDAPTPSGFYGHYATDPNNAVVQRGILTPGAKYSDGKIHPAWPSFIHDAWEGYKAFADADPRDNSQEATDRLSKAAFDVSGLAMTGGLAAPRPANSIGMFGGRLAKTADQAALAEAEKMAASGADRQAIWDATGWFQGPDKKWRFEIDDSAQKMLRSLDELARANPMPSDMVFKHDALHAAYPKVADTNWYLTKELESGGGSFDPGRGIRVGDGAGFASGKNGPGGITLHEQQHVIQGIEDFGRGGNRDFGNKADDVRREAQKAYEASMARPVDDPDVALLRELGIELPPPPTVPWDQLPARKQLEWHEAGRGRAYNALAGETEARTVQKRMDLTPEERRARPPWLDYDVPETDQIVRFSEGKFGSSASTTPGGDGAFTLPSTQVASKGERISGKADSQGSLNQTTAEFLKERYGDSSTTGDLLYSNPKESAAIPLGVKAAEQKAAANAADNAVMKPYVAPDEYRGQHGAPDHESGSPLHDVTSNGIYPKDFYGPNGRRYYGTGDDAMDAATFDKIYRMQSKPDEMVAIYRAIPEVAGKKKGLTLSSSHINPGDWVSISRQYAVEHGESALNGKYHLTKRMVPARELFTAGDSIHEWGWSPKVK